VADKPRDERIEAEVTGDVTADVSGDVSGQLIIGSGNKQVRIEQTTAPVTEAELAELRALLAQLREEVAATAPPEQRQAATERIGELKQAVLAPKPDLTTMEYVRNWFLKHLPALAGTVTGLVINPIVGKLVEAGGDALSAEFRRRFGVPPGKR
jgi:hypothetical protein